MVLLQVILCKQNSKSSRKYNSYNLEDGGNHLALDYDLYSYDNVEMYSKAASTQVSRFRQMFHA